MLTVLEVEIHRLKRGGQVWAAATTSLKNWDRKVFFLGGDSLFAVGMRGGAPWKVAVGTGTTLGMLCANTVTLFLVWRLREMERD